MPRKLREKLGLPDTPWEEKTDEMAKEWLKGERNLRERVKEDLIERGYTEEQAEQLAEEDIDRLRENKGLDITADVEPKVPREERPFPEGASKETFYGPGMREYLTREALPDDKIKVTKYADKFISPEEEDEVKIVSRKKFLKQIRKRPAPEKPTSIPLTTTKDN